MCDSFKLDRRKPSVGLAIVAPFPDQCMFSHFNNLSCFLLRRKRTVDKQIGSEEENQHLGVKGQGRASNFLFPNFIQLSLFLVHHLMMGTSLASNHTLNWSLALGFSPRGQGKLMTTDAGCAASYFLLSTYILDFLFRDHQVNFDTVILWTLEKRT